MLKVSYQNKDSVPKVMVTNYLPNFGKSMINIISEEHKKADLVATPFRVSFCIGLLPLFFQEIIFEGGVTIKTKYL